ncbi:MAG: ATP phosphoribosyltransferase regulatory subunit [Clostridia bacterium]|nr:ATP phosphoribosyltransferase regulatory subunit [Clostridia bacterium]
MELDERVLKNGEHAVFRLRALYRKYGYAQYKMSKFEEYDLYVQNKDFLVGDGVITFNDTDGKLLALKPDVTLSIIKKTTDEEHVLHKLCYNENVYRISGSTHTFGEIMQTGLECIGEIGVCETAEVLMLALESLETIGGASVLDLSHLGVISALLDDTGADEIQKKRLIACIGEKNPHGIREICASIGADASLTEKLSALVRVYGKPKQVYQKLRALSLGEKAEAALAELETLTDTLDAIGVGENVRIDFSVVNDMNYYSGVVFRGFVDGIPEGILSGGRYDRLMRKMGRRSGAIGFALYLDLLECLDRRAKQYDADTVLVYGDDAEPAALLGAVRTLTEQGASVRMLRKYPEGLRCRRLMAFQNGGVVTLENND